MLLPAVFSAILASPASATPAAPCTPARAGKHVAAQPEAWRQAVEALLSSSATPGQPWSCVGGEVDLEVGTSSATLTVIDAQSHAISREIASPDDVAPLGEALLSKPLEEPAPTQPPPPTPTAQPEPVATPARDPRLLLAATVGPRYAGPGHMMLGSFQALAAVPFRPWAGGVWIRYDGFSTSLERRIPPIRELSLGAVAYWIRSVGRVEIRPMLKPSLAVVTRAVIGGGSIEGDHEPSEPIFIDKTDIDFRVGVEAQFAVRLTRRLRAVVGLDAEIAPKQIVSTFSAPLNFGKLPIYTVGLGLGLEVAVP